MTLYKFIVNSYTHYFKQNFTVSLGIAITTAVITGALLTGDSVSFSLEKTVMYRLGHITHSIEAVDSYFTRDLGYKMAKETGFAVSSCLLTKGSAIAGGGQMRINKVNIIGVDSAFKNVLATDFSYDSIMEDKAIISENLANRLMLKQGDFFMIRMQKASLIPLNTPFVSDAEQIVSKRIEVQNIARKEHFGRFDTQNSQTAPYTVFVNINWLNNAMNFNNKANRIFLSATENISKETIATNFTNAWQIEDGNFILKLLKSKNKDEDEWELTSSKVFINEYISRDIISGIKNVKPVLTYFVNNFRNNKLETPYSFVSSVPDTINPDEIIVNDWLAADISAKAGDTIDVSYFEIGPLRKLVEKELKFSVRQVIPINTQGMDKSLMPYLPGLTNAGNCRDWQTGVPIELDKIRDKDEEYWNKYKGTPKALISISTAEKLWKNRFGTYTALRFKAPGMNPNEVKSLLKKKINPSSSYIAIKELKNNGLYAAKNAVDFAQLFIGLSFFILVSGIILTVLLFILSLSRRSGQIATLSALGFRKRQIRITLLSEGLLVATTGAVLGVFLAIAYNELVFKGLNKVWYDIARTSILETRVSLTSLIKGFVISVLISWLSIVMVVQHKLKQSIADVHKQTIQGTNYVLLRIKKIATVFLLILILSLVTGQVLSSKILNPTLFFISGILFILFFVLLTDIFISRSDTRQNASFSYKILIIRSIAANRSRSLTVVVLLCLGTFIVVSTGANREDLSADATLKSSGTGGFLLISESTVPILKDLSDKKVKQEFSLGDSITIAQFRIFDGDDASCLNLNRISNPRILGIDPRDMEGRFSFVTQTADLDKFSPWLSLDKQFGDVIPAIADQTVIKWGLGMEVGDTLVYRDATGKEVKLKLIGGLANSILQGNVIISNRHFLINFSSSSGSNVFLIEKNSSSEEEITEELQFAFRDFGMETENCVDRLINFNSVENTYLSIFMLLGAFGLLLGTIGLAIILIRGILDRGNEIAVLLSIGYSDKLIVRLISREYILLLFAGIVSGAIASIVSVLPVFLSDNASFGFVILLLVIILLNGIAWIVLITKLQIKRLKIVSALRNE